MTPEEKAKRAAHARERRAEDKAAKEAWKARVEAHFGFLREQYGFTITSVETWFWGTKVTYETETTKLWVDRSVEFNGVEVWLQLKPKYPFPGQPVYVTMNLTHEPITAAFIARVRAPALADEVKGTAGLSEDAIESGLTLFARVLKEHGDDLLRGDFAAFGAQSAYVWDKPPRQPVITVWMPESRQAQWKEWIAAVERRSPGIRVIYRTFKTEPDPIRRAKAQACVRFAVELTYLPDGRPHPTEKRATCRVLWTSSRSRSRQRPHSPHSLWTPARGRSFSHRLHRSGHLGIVYAFSAGSSGSTGRTGRSGRPARRRRRRGRSNS